MWCGGMFLLGGGEQFQSDEQITQLIQDRELRGHRAIGRGPVLGFTHSSPATSLF